MTNLASNEVHASVKPLKVLLANSYSVYLQTQNYHWNVRGPLFFSLHQLFEQQYTQLAVLVDEVAERIRALGAAAPATFAEFMVLSTVPTEPEAQGAALTAQQMVQNLLVSHTHILSVASVALADAEAMGDVATVDVFTQVVNALEKNSWMLRTVIE